MRRTLIAACAVLLLAIAAALGIWQQFETLRGGWQPLAAACLRVGLLMGALWLAWPQLNRLPSWLLGALCALLIVLALRPRFFVLAIVIALAVAIMRPGKAKANSE